MHMQDGKAGNSGINNRAAHLAEHCFKPGQSGNPNGRPKVPNEVKRLAREASPRAMQKLIALIDNDDAKVALMAAKEVLDRAYGKVAPAEDDETGAKNVTINIVKLTDDRNHAAPQLDAATVSIRPLAVS